MTSHDLIITNLTLRITITITITINFEFVFSKNYERYSTYGQLCCGICSRTGYAQDCWALAEESGQFESVELWPVESCCGISV